MSSGRQQQQVTSSSIQTPASAAPTSCSSSASVALPSSSTDPTMTMNTGNQEKANAAYESLFDSGYSATAMSLNSSSDVHHPSDQSSREGNAPSSLPPGKGTRNTPSLPPGKGAMDKMDPSGDSGLCIDSGLSIECSSPDPERTPPISFQQHSVPCLKSQPGLKASVGGQQTIGSSTTLPSSSSSSSSSSTVTRPANYIDPNYECFINNSFAQDEDGDTLLHLAIIKESTRLALEIINIAPHPDCLDMRNHLYQTPLILAALTGQSTIAHQLILAGATIDKRDRFGFTPLHLACEKGDIDMATTLVPPVSQPELTHFTRKAKYRSSPLSEQHGSSDSGQLGSKYGSSDSGQLGSKCGSSDSGQLGLSDTWTNNVLGMVHAMNYEGQTCIHLAAKSGNKKLIEFLIKLGADVNIREGKSGWTILHWSIFHSKVDLVQFLIHSCRANVNTLSYAGHSCLHLAYTMLSNSSILSYNPSLSNQEQKIKNIISLLIEAGASHNLLATSSDSEYSSSDDE